MLHFVRNSLLPASQVPAHTLQRRARSARRTNANKKTVPVCTTTAAQRFHFEQQPWRASGCRLMRVPLAWLSRGWAAPAGQRSEQLPAAFGLERAGGGLGTVAGCEWYVSPCQNHHAAARDPSSR